MKVLFVPDVPDWAIGHLVQSKIKHLPQFITKMRPVHPREALSQAEDFLRDVKEFEPDVIIYEYFRSAEQLINAQPELKKYKSILVHHNQRDKALYHADWNELGIHTIVTHTNKCREKLNQKGYYNVHTINHGIDLDFFEFSDKEPAEKQVGYVGRILPWKGLKDIAIACEELGYPVQVMGKPDSPDYWEQIPKDNLRFDYFKCSDEERVDAYHNMTIYVGNSEDDYEEGTLPFLEALSCGVPVVTTRNGVANDIIVDGVNGLVVPFKDPVALKNAIQRLMEDSDLRKTLREGGWNTVKNMSEQKMAYEYGQLINEVVNDEEIVSVIIPATYDRKDCVQDILMALENQSYNAKAIEAIIVWDEVERKEMELDRPEKVSALQLFTLKDGYNLALARNLGAIESNGRYLMFCDSRLKPSPDAVLQFVEAINGFGDKGANKNSFVENFSCILRENFFKFGMMNERIDKYGGMSQEIRTRYRQQGGEFSYLPMVTAEQMTKSGMSPQKRKDIAEMKFKLLRMYKGEAY